MESQVRAKALFKSRDFIVNRIDRVAVKTPSPSQTGSDCVIYLELHQFCERLFYGLISYIKTYPTFRRAAYELFVELSKSRRLVDFQEFICYLKRHQDLKWQTFSSKICINLTFVNVLASDAIIRTW
jgi:hypothetical protein